MTTKDSVLIWTSNMTISTTPNPPIRLRQNLLTNSFRSVQREDENMGIQSQRRIGAIERCRQRGASRQTPAYRQAAVNDISTEGFVSLLHCEICKGNEANKINKALSKLLIRVPHRPHDKRCMKKNRNTTSFSSSTISSSKRKSSTPGEGSQTKKSQKSVATKKRESEQCKAQEIAKRAAALAEQTVANPEMAKKLLLSMALVRENPRTLPLIWPQGGLWFQKGSFGHIICH